MLKINNLKKQYDDFSLNCSMEILPGRITGLVGKNGSGKTTTFKAALGLIHKDAGEIEMLGSGIEKLKGVQKQKLGVVLSDSGFSTYLTVKDISHILKNTYLEYNHFWFMEKCRHFELPMDKKLKEFSSGMRAKLKMLVAMCHNASLLILDEPTVGLDVIAREELLDMLRSYMEEDENRGILISSHISSDLENLCDDFYMIHEGKIVLHEETHVLLSDYGVLKAERSQFEKLDKTWLLKYKEEAYGYSCLTNQGQYYRENYPGLVLEKGNIDDLILLMVGGRDL